MREWYVSTRTHIPPVYGDSLLSLISLDGGQTLIGDQSTKGRAAKFFP